MAHVLSRHGPLLCPKCVCRDGLRRVPDLIIWKRGDLVTPLHPAVAGATAGIALIALDERYGESADRADVASATLLIVGAALTLAAAGRGAEARRTVVMYWIVAVVAAVPLSVDAWCERRKRGASMRRLAAHIAGRDYRAEAP